jgi:hypothetical protein
VLCSQKSHSRRWNALENKQIKCQFLSSVSAPTVDVNYWLHAASWPLCSKVFSVCSNVYQKWHFNAFQKMRKIKFMLTFQVSSPNWSHPLACPAFLYPNGTAGRAQWPAGKKNWQNIFFSQKIFWILVASHYFHLVLTVSFFYSPPPKKKTNLSLFPVSIGGSPELNWIFSPKKAFFYLCKMLPLYATTMLFWENRHFSPKIAIITLTPWSKSVFRAAHA